MRIRVTLQVERETTIPINYQHQLSSAIYRFLEASDANYAQFLHEEGYAPTTTLGTAQAPDTTAVTMRRRFKLFTFSLLKAQRSRVQGDQLYLSPGELEWFVASPVEEFLTNFANGLLSLGQLQVGSKYFGVAHVETLTAPEFQETTRFKCLSPLVASVGESADGKRFTRYLRPKDPAFSERVRQNLLAKYSALHGTVPDDDRLKLTFDAKYLEQHRGTKLVTYKDGIQIVGAFAPFTLCGSSNLVELAYSCGVGEKNAAGFGMIEVVR
jgi:CRISPR-associated endoribonuclease Cas6